MNGSGGGGGGGAKKRAAGVATRGDAYLPNILQGMLFLKFALISFLVVFKAFSLPFFAYSFL